MVAFLGNHGDDVNGPLNIMLWWTLGYVVLKGGDFTP